MDILNDRVRPLYLRLLFAASGSSMMASVFGMVDAMMVGQYHGPAGNAALAVFNPLWSLVYSLGIFVGIGGSVFFANSRGAGKEETAREYFTLSMLYGVGLAAAAMAAVALFHEEMFYFFGADEELLGLAKRYLKCVYFAIPCCVFDGILSAFLRNDGNPGLAMKAVLIGGAFNVFGDVFFVFTLDMGIFGAGLATATGIGITTLLMLTHFLSERNTLRLVRPAAALRKLMDISGAGAPAALCDLAMGIIGILFNRRIMQFLGSAALAVYGVTAQVAVFAQCLSYGVGQASQPIISQNFGAGRFERIEECTRYALITCAAFGILWAGLMQLAPVPLIHMFMRPTPEVLGIAPHILRIYGLSFLLLPFNLFTTYYFQSLMRPRLAMACSLARGVFVSGAAIMLLPVLFGGESIWYSMPLTELIVAVFGAVFMLRCMRRMRADNGV